MKSEFEHFQKYMWKKYKIQKIYTKITKETIFQYFNSLCQIDVNAKTNNQIYIKMLIRNDPIFLNFLGVVGQVANFDKDFTVLKKGLTHKIFKNQYIYYAQQVVHHNETQFYKQFIRCICCKSSKKLYLKLNSQSLTLFQTSEETKFLQIKQTIIITNQIQIRIRVQIVSEYFNIKLSNGINFIFVAFQTFLDLILFVTSLSLCLNDSGYLQKNKYSSFAIERINCRNNFFIDGQDYFKELCQMLYTAKRQICITDWMLTPYFLLKRPKGQSECAVSRIDKILFYLANQRKINIYILLFSEPLMMYQDSQHVQQYFEKASPYIHIIRHPNLVIPILWSHHEKMVIIDEKIGFLGGLDIAYGRWDNPSHKLVDLENLWPGKDYRNDRLKDITSPRKYLKCDIDKINHPRMPWHDIGIKIQGKSVIDLKRHFTQYWYFAIKDLLNPQKYFQDQIQIKVSDALAIESVQNNSGLKYFTNEEEIKYYRKRLKKTQSQIQQIPGQDKVNKFRRRNIKDYEKYKKLQIKGLHKENNLILENFSNATHNLVRSSSHWSLGITNRVQQSIHFGYIQLIKHAHDFIYIQNQFIMGIQNKALDALIQRIQRAYQNKHDNFKVIIFFPLLPGFPGQIDSSQSAVLKIQLYWQYQTICRGQNSIFQRLKHIQNLQNYISFFGLRTHGVIGENQNKKPITEIIYIHSKLMIVDDKYSIIGSANFNDRSLLGTRDSQIAIVSSSNQGCDEIKNLRCKLFAQHFGIPLFQASHFSDPIFRPKIYNKIKKIAHQNTLIYRQLFKCYPDDQYKSFQDIKNNKIQSQNIGSGQGDILHDNRRLIYEELKIKIKGHAVQNPLKFLQKQDLRFTPFQVEFYAPEKMFT